MQLVKTAQIDALFKSAESSLRKRAHLNLHKTYEDKVQRLYIALICGSYVEPHYHEKPHQWEMFIVKFGLVRVNIHNFEGVVTNSFLVGDEQDSFTVEFLPGDIHSVECISEKALLLEIKEGPFIETEAKTTLK